MYADCQGNMLNTVAVRASYILPILKRFLSENPRKPGGGGVVYLPPEITKTETTLPFQVLG